MFAQLGNIQFNLITYFSFIEEQKQKGYSELKRLQNKPKLQKKGDELDRLTLKLKFHSSFCDPEFEFNRIKKLANTDEAQAFIYGNGIYKGNYVIEQIKSSTNQTDSTGGVIAIEAELQLIEWVEDDPILIKKIKKISQAKKKSTAIKKVKKEVDPYSGNIEDYLNSTQEDKDSAIIKTITRQNTTDEYIQALTKPRPAYISSA